MEDVALPQDILVLPPASYANRYNRIVYDLREALFAQASDVNMSPFEIVKDIFTLIDFNESGVVTSLEMLAFLKLPQLNLFDPNEDTKTVEKFCALLLEQIDENGDCVISLEELASFIFPDGLDDSQPFEFELGVVYDVTRKAILSKIGVEDNRTDDNAVLSSFAALANASVQNGFLDDKYVKKILLDLFIPEFSRNLSETEADLIIRKLDLENQGHISSKLFRNWLHPTRKLDEKIQLANYLYDLIRSRYQGNVRQLFSDFSAGEEKIYKPDFIMNIKAVDPSINRQFTQELAVTLCAGETFISFGNIIDLLGYCRDYQQGVNQAKQLKQLLQQDDESPPHPHLPASEQQQQQSNNHPAIDNFSPASSRHYQISGNSDDAVLQRQRSSRAPSPFVSPPDSVEYRQDHYHQQEQLQFQESSEVTLQRRRSSRAPSPSPYNQTPLSTEYSDLQQDQRQNYEQFPAKLSPSSQRRQSMSQSQYQEEQHYGEPPHQLQTEREIENDIVLQRRRSSRAPSPFVDHPQQQQELQDHYQDHYHQQEQLQFQESSEVTLQRRRSSRAPSPSPYNQTPLSTEYSDLQQDQRQNYEQFPAKLSPSSQRRQSVSQSQYQQEQHYGESPHQLQTEREIENDIVLQRRRSSRAPSPFVDHPQQQQELQDHYQDHQNNETRDREREQIQRRRSSSRGPSPFLPQPEYSNDIPLHPRSEELSPPHRNNNVPMVSSLDTSPVSPLFQQQVQQGIGETGVAMIPDHSSFIMGLHSPPPLSKRRQQQLASRSNSYHGQQSHSQNQNQNTVQAFSEAPPVDSASLSTIVAKNRKTNMDSNSMIFQTPPPPPSVGIERPSASRYPQHQVNEWEEDERNLGFQPNQSEIAHNPNQRNTPFIDPNSRKQQQQLQFSNHTTPQQTPQLSPRQQSQDQQQQEHQQAHLKLSPRQQQQQQQMHYQDRRPSDAPPLNSRSNSFSPPPLASLPSVASGLPPFHHKGSSPREKEHSYSFHSRSSRSNSNAAPPPPSTPSNSNHPGHLSRSGSVSLANTTTTNTSNYVSSYNKIVYNLREALLRQATDRAMHHFDVVKEIFAKIDDNNSGVLTSQEMLTFLKLPELHLFEESESLLRNAEKFCSLLLEQIDENGDGTISFDELAAFIFPETDLRNPIRSVNNQGGEGGGVMEYEPGIIYDVTRKALISKLSGAAAQGSDDHLLQQFADLAKASIRKGYLENRSAKKALLNLYIPEFSRNLLDHEVELIIRKLDSDNHGRISSKSFHNWLFPTNIKQHEEKTHLANYLYKIIKEKYFGNVRELYDAFKSYGADCIYKADFITNIKACDSTIPRQVAQDLASQLCGGEKFITYGHIIDLLGFSKEFEEEESHRRNSTIQPVEDPLSMIPITVTHSGDDSSGNSFDAQDHANNNSNIPQYYNFTTPLRTAGLTVDVIAANDNNNNSSFLPPPPSALQQQQSYPQSNTLIVSPPTRSHYQSKGIIIPQRDPSITEEERIAVQKLLAAASALTPLGKSSKTSPSSLSPLHHAAMLRKQQQHQEHEQEYFPLPPSPPAPAEEQKNDPISSKKTISVPPPPLDIPGERSLSSSSSKREGALEKARHGALGYSSNELAEFGIYQHSGRWRGFPYDSYTCCNTSQLICPIAEKESKAKNKFGKRNISASRNRNRYTTATVPNKNMFPVKHERKGGSSSLNQHQHNSNKTYTATTAQRNVLGNSPPPSSSLQGTVQQSRRDHLNGKYSNAGGSGGAGAFALKKTPSDKENSSLIDYHPLPLHAPPSSSSSSLEAMEAEKIVALVQELKKDIIKVNEKNHLKFYDQVTKEINDQRNGMTQLEKKVTEKLKEVLSSLNRK